MYGSIDEAEQPKTSRKAGVIAATIAAGLALFAVAQVSGVAFTRASPDGALYVATMSDNTGGIGTLIPGHGGFFGVAPAAPVAPTQPVQPVMGRGVNVAPPSPPAPPAKPVDLSPAWRPFPAYPSTTQPVEGGHFPEDGMAGEIGQGLTPAAGTQSPETIALADTLSGLAKENGGFFKSDVVTTPATDTQSHWPMSGGLRAPGHGSLRSSASRTTLGGDLDAHGCCSSCGYSWSDSLGKCARSWETPSAVPSDVVATGRRPEDGVSPDDHDFFAAQNGGVNPFATFNDPSTFFDYHARSDDDASPAHLDRLGFFALGLFAACVVQRLRGAPPAPAPAPVKPRLDP